jgi:hypothetical protein
VVWQSAIGTGIHGTDERGDCVSEIALVEIVEGSLLAPLDVFFARHVDDQGSVHVRHPKNLFMKIVDEFGRTAPIRLLQMRRTDIFRSRCGN